MNRFQRMASVVSLVTMGVAGSAAVAHASPEAAAHGEAPEGQRHHGHGRGDLVRASLRLDSLTQAQRQQIEGLVGQEKSAHANVRAARTQLVDAVAGGVAAGNVDDVALSPNVRAVESAIAADEPGDRAAIEKLHAILTPAQRAELVGRLESHAHRGGERARDRGAKADGGAAHAEHGPRGMGRELGLSDAQREQIRVNLRSIGAPLDRSAWKAEAETHRRVLEAFKGDRFVMNEVAPPRDARVVEQEAMGMVRMAKATAPVLTPEQRATAAARLRERAAHESK